MAKLFNFVYETENLLNGKKYIGKHSTDNLNDGYLGTGELIKKAIRKYKSKNFRRTIIKFFDTEDEAYHYEGLLINETIINSPMYYNLDLGGKGSMKGRKHTLESKQKTSSALKGIKKPTRTPRHIENHLKAMAPRKKPPKIKKVRTFKRGSENALYGKPRDKDSIDKIKESNRKHLIWTMYNELLNFWILNDKPGWRKMERLAVENGYPKTAYDKIIKQFKQDTE